MMNNLKYVVFLLPIPPSINDYWKLNRKLGSIYIHQKGRDYRQKVKEIIQEDEDLRGVVFDTNIKVEIDCYFSNNCRRDIDNINKCLLDSLQHAGIIVDDYLVDELIVRRNKGEIIKNNGLLHIRISEREDISHSKFD